ncbi:hypothetical protein Aab01nite_10980 [Paractinoplanes abujensis]|nr:hypothetical protein Aab01nite_10980 [Actinoplanes abujensis]
MGGRAGELLEDEVAAGGTGPNRASPAASAAVELVTLNPYGPLHRRAVTASVVIAQQTGEHP